jgi:glycosyltransferase involved in cell wall biosynthesis
MMHNIVIAAYNAEAHIAEALTSALKQTYSELRIIVVDDGSTDSTAEILKSFNDPRVCLIQQKNGGQLSAWERASKEISYSGLVFLLDADDRMLPERVRKVDAEYRKMLLEEGRRIAIFQHSLEIVGDTQGILDPQRYLLTSQTEKNLIDVARELRDIPRFIPSSGLAIPSGLFAAVFPLDSDWRICADAFLTMRLAAYGSFVSIGDVLGQYRIHEDNNWCKAKERKQVLKSKIAFSTYLNRELGRHRQDPIDFIFAPSFSKRVMKGLKRRLPF